MHHEEPYLEIRFAGKGASGPEHIRARDLADAIEAFEQLVVSELKASGEDVNPNDVVVGLVDVRAGSARFRFKSSYMVAALAAFVSAARHVHEKAYGEMQTTSAKALQTLQKVGRKYNGDVELRTHEQQDEDAEPLALIPREERIELPTPPCLEGITTLYGKVARVGGSTPKVWLDVQPGERLVCEVDEDLARQIAARLYEFVGLRGVARWNLDTAEIEDFEIQALLPYEQTGAMDAFAALAEVSAEDFTGVQDVVRYAEMLRGERDLDSDTSDLSAIPE